MISKFGYRAWKQIKKAEAKLWTPQGHQNLTITIDIRGQEPYKISAADTFGRKKMLRVWDGIEHYGELEGFDTKGIL